MRLAIAPIVAELKRAGLRNVEGLLEFSRQVVAPRSLPAFFVVPTGETTGGNANDAGRDQGVDVSFSVMVVLDGARLAKGGVSEDLREQTGHVVDALVGWTHPQASRACAYAGGRLGSADGSTVVWEVRVRTRYHLRKAS